MQFTPQQLTGGPKYHHQTRIGNWSEDQELEEIRLKDFLAQKEGGQLKVTAKQQQLEECLRREDLSESEDGFLRFGQKVVLFNQQSKGLLSVNPYDAVAKAFPAYTLTTSHRPEAVVRNVFVLERADEDDGFEGEEIHYGQIVRCAMMPFGSKIKEPTYMHSEMVTALAAAKFSRHQEVTAFAARSGETKWQFLFPDVQQQLEMEGEPVSAGCPVLVKHVATGSFLASDEIPYDNIFGRENEVHCFPYFSLNKTQNLVGEKRGDITGDVPLRRMGLPNIWTVQTATHCGGPSDATK